MSEQYNWIDTQLPNFTSLINLCYKWLRPYHWKNKKMSYTRPAAVPFAATAGQQERLRGLLYWNAKATEAVANECMRLWAAEAFKLKEGDERARVWPTDLHRKFLSRALEVTTGRGLLRTSTDGVAYERATVHAADQCRTKVLLGNTPILYYSTELPAGLSVRLNSGVQYGYPMEGNKGWVLLREIGWVHIGVENGMMLDAGDELRKALYAEVAHADQKWHIRFVFSQPVVKVAMLAASAQPGPVVQQVAARVVAPEPVRAPTPAAGSHEMVVRRSINRDRVHHGQPEIALDDEKAWAEVF
jgi:hypothetical protein